jgi:hypothetical protein
MMNFIDDFVTLSPELSGTDAERVVIVGCWINDKA